MVTWVWKHWFRRRSWCRCRW